MWLALRRLISPGGENLLDFLELRHVLSTYDGDLRDSGNGGTTLEFLLPCLWRAPPLEMRRERREFFPDHAGKGYLLSLGGGNGAPLDVGGTLLLPLE